MAACQAECRKRIAVLRNQSKRSDSLTKKLHLMVCLAQEVIANYPNSYSVGALGFTRMPLGADVVGRLCVRGATVR